MQNCSFVKDFELEQVADSSYREFIGEVMDRVRNSLGTEYTCSLVQTLKNNGTKLHGLSVTGSGVEACPMFYLDDYYQDNSAVKTANQIVNQMISLGGDGLKLPIGVKDIAKFSSVRDSIIFKLVGTESNEEMLQSVPHKRLEDLAIIYQICVFNDGAQLGTTTIQQGLFDTWGISIEHLHETALGNTPDKLPAKFRDMREVITEMTGMDLTEDDAATPSMCILSNSIGVNGAGVLVYPGELASIGERIHSDFYVLPSSVHEVLIIPVSDSVTVDGLAQMVSEVNATQVAPEEVLSNSVYIYSREDDSFRLAVQAR